MECPADLGVGTVLFCVNQLGVVIRGDATALVWIKVAITYLAPFAKSNVGILIAHTPPGRPVGPRLIICRRVQEAPMRVTVPGVP